MQGVTNEPPSQANLQRDVLISFTFSQEILNLIVVGEKGIISRNEKFPKLSSETFRFRFYEKNSAEQTKTFSGKLLR